MSYKVFFVEPFTTNPPWAGLSPGKNLTTQGAEVPSLYYKIHDSRAELCVQGCQSHPAEGGALLDFPIPRTPPASVPAFGFPWTAAASTEWAKPRNCLLEKPNTTREGEKYIYILKKKKSYTGHSYHYEKSNELLYIHIANNFTSWEMSLLSLPFPWGWRVLVCWMLAWDVQSHSESMLSVVVGVLNKIDGVGASWWILLDLEVLCWQAKGAQHQIAQILQFACNDIPGEHGESWARGNSHGITPNHTAQPWFIHHR